MEAVNTDNSRKNLSPRHQVFLELVQTESNYVGILSTIMTVRDMYYVETDSRAIYFHTMTLFIFLVV